MHTKKKGKAKSRKPVVELGKPPQGAKVAPKRIEDLAVEYAKQGMAPAAIGERLKREHEVLYIKQHTGKRLVQMLADRGIRPQIPSDLMDLMKKAVNMHEHLASNKQDTYSAIRLRRVESKIWRLTKYYTREGRLPEGWRYNPEQAKLQIKGNA